MLVINSDAELSKYLSRSGRVKTSLTVEEKTAVFVYRSHIVHAGRYSYDNTAYTNASSKVEIGCPIHGMFLQSPNHHLKGSGCTRCGGKDKKTTEYFIEEAIKVHGDSYKYTNTVYKGMKYPVTITCHIHGDFSATPAAHLQGFGKCKECKGDVSSHLYLWRLGSTDCYKVGVTGSSTYRIDKLAKKYNVQPEILIFEFIGDSVYEVESKCKSYLISKYKRPITSGNEGFTEIFEIPSKEASSVRDHVIDLVNFYLQKD